MFKLVESLLHDNIFQVRKEGIATMKALCDIDKEFFEKKIKAKLGEYLLIKDNICIRQDYCFAFIVESE